RFVKPGARRVASDASSDPKIGVAAFTQSGLLVLVAVNARGEPVSATFDLKQFRPGGPIKAVRTSQLEDWATLPDLSPADSTFTADLPAGSTTTFIVRGTDLTSAEPAPRAQP